MKRLVPLWLLVVSLLVPRAAGAVELAVDLVNAEARAVSVPTGTDNGVTKGSDFEILLPDNTVVPIYPHELFDKRFWTAPLPPDFFAMMTPGLRVRPATLDPEAHDRIRAEGAARARGHEAEIAAAKTEAARREADGLREKRDRLEDRIATAEKALSEEEGRMARVDDSEERDIDRSIQNILDDSDRRDELQAQRAALAGQRPRPSTEINRLASEVRRLNDRIASERESIRMSRDRMRAARASYLERKREWQALVAERKSLVNEIKVLERRIREGSGD